MKAKKLDRRGVTCASCSASDKIVKAGWVVELYGIETPVCNKCKEDLENYG